jgi:hypothetical protein
VDATGQLWTCQQKIGTMPPGQHTPAPDVSRQEASSKWRQRMGCFLGL